MTEDTYGPATRWLAERAGVPPEQLVHDPMLMLRELGTATREATELAAAGNSEELVAELTAGPTPGERFGRSVAAALRAQAERLRSTATD
jgi:hypothetical protein